MVSHKRTPQLITTNPNSLFPIKTANRSRSILNFTPGPISLIRCSLYKPRRISRRQTENDPPRAPRIKSAMETLLYEATVNGHAADASETPRVIVDVGVGTPSIDEETSSSGGFSRLPSTHPVDLQFENITFTAPLGFRKGRLK